MRSVPAILISIALSFTSSSMGAALTDDQLQQIKFDQRLNEQISPDLAFRDEAGKQIRLGDYFGKRPTILILGYYGCPMLCSLTLNGSIESFRQLKQTVGDQFDVVFVSIDPTESSALAAGKKRNYFQAYHRGSPNGWHFLTGDKTSIQKIADEAGFHFAYDSTAKQYAHPSGFIVLTPEGKISHYFFGVTFSPKELNAALHDAADRKITSPVEQFVLLCFHYAPIKGRYGNLAMTIVRAGGIATIVALAGFLIRSNQRNSSLNRKRRRRLMPAVTDSP